MNNTMPPFDNEQVRQAFAMAIDKARIVKNFFPTGSTVAEQFVYPELKAWLYGWHDLVSLRSGEGQTNVDRRQV